MQFEFKSFSDQGKTGDFSMMMKEDEITLADYENLMIWPTWHYLNSIDNWLHHEMITNDKGTYYQGSEIVPIVRALEAACLQ